MPVARHLLSLMACESEVDGQGARVQTHAANVAAGLGVFEPPPLPRTGPEPARCWLCGKSAGRSAHVRKLGWAVRLVRFWGQYTADEVYCPECFAEHGWPECPGGKAVA